MQTVAAYATVIEHFSPSVNLFITGMRQPCGTLSALLSLNVQRHSLRGWILPRYTYDLFHYGHSYAISIRGRVYAISLVYSYILFSICLV